MDYSKNPQNAQESATLKLNEPAKGLIKQGHKVYNLTAGELDFPTPAAIMKGVAKNLRQNKYTPALGLPELREKIAAFLNQKYKTFYNGRPISP